MGILAVGSIQPGIEGPQEAPSVAVASISSGTVDQWTVVDVADRMGPPMQETLRTLVMRVVLDAQGSARSAVMAAVAQ